ncbi:uncharacterized protein G2W53_024820 [Senna tora]|uniref:Uncharacterized protein n=1 Tax=Senna tora TaxID=362788 RepID=A0A834WDI3_9FABA|nr:uncharacterized protein G2W53_024820 [Senna tora]
MDIQALVNSLLNHPDEPLAFPWERGFDVMEELYFYRNNRTNLMIFDMRPLINFGGGTIVENYKWYDIADGPTTLENLIIQTQPSPISLHYSINFPSFCLYRACCTPIPMHLIVSQPVFQCPFCRCLILWPHNN